MPPARVFSSNNMIQARLVESRLKEAGLPIELRHGQTGVPVLQPGGPFEIWIEDDALLERAEIQETIRDALNPSKFTAEEEEEIAAMPFHDEPSEVGYGALLAVCILVIAVLVLLLKYYPDIARFFGL